MRRGDLAARNVRSQPPVQVIARPEPIQWTTVREEATDAVHCISVCLYREPQFAARFPTRNFGDRYLFHGAQLADHLAALGCHLQIFVDEAMLETALWLQCGSVHLVTTPPAFPFEQHLWRYLAAAMPAHPTLRAIHFRGMDNVMIGPREHALLQSSFERGMEILRAPYVRPAGRLYMPVRGSCSVMHGAVASLGRWLQSRALRTPEEWPDLWHNDELLLSAWFARACTRHHVHTLQDRELPDAWLQEQNRIFGSGLESLVERIPTAPSQRHRYDARGLHSAL